MNSFLLQYNAVNSFFYRTQEKARNIVYLGKHLFLRENLGDSRLLQENLSDSRLLRENLGDSSPLRENLGDSLSEKTKLLYT